VNAGAGTCVSGKQGFPKETRKSMAVIIIVVKIQSAKPFITNFFNQIERGWLMLRSEGGILPDVFL